MQVFLLLIFKNQFFLVSRFYKAYLQNLKADPLAACRHRKTFHKKCIFSEIARRDQGRAVVAKFEEAPLAEIPLSDTSWNDRAISSFIINLAPLQKARF